MSAVGLHGGVASAEFNGSYFQVKPVYRETLGAAIEAAEARVKHVDTHEQLFSLFTLLVGDMPKTKAKLAKRLGHQNLQILPHTQGTKSVRGFGAQWQTTPAELEEWRRVLTEEAQAEAAAGKEDPVSGHRRVRRERSDEQGG